MTKSTPISTRSNHPEKPLAPSPTTPSQRTIQRISGRLSSLMRLEDVKAFQATVGNHATRRILESKQVLSPDLSGMTTVQRGKETEDSESSSDSFDFNKPPWDSAVGAEVKDSGMGGAVIITFKSGEKLAVKSGSDGVLNAEVLANRMARETGLKAPETRKASSEENDLIPDIFKQLGAVVKWGSPYLIVDYVPGVLISTIGNGIPSKSQVFALATEMGKWFAFNAMSNDSDNIHGLGGGNLSVNTGNFFAGGQDNSEVIGIDQHAFGGDAKIGVLEKLKSGDDYYAYGVAGAIYKSLGSPKGIDSEDLIDPILKGAKQQIEVMANKLDKDKILELSKGLDVNKLDEIIERVEIIAKTFK